MCFLLVYICIIYFSLALFSLTYSLVCAPRNSARDLWNFMSYLSLRLNFQAAASGCRTGKRAVVRDRGLSFAADDGCERQWHQWWPVQGCSAAAESFVEVCLPIADLPAVGVDFCFAACLAAVVARRESCSHSACMR